MGIFPDYDQGKGKGQRGHSKGARNSSRCLAKYNKFDPDEARKNMERRRFSGSKERQQLFMPQFPELTTVSLTFNTNESNKDIAEFVQAQWKQKSRHRDSSQEPGIQKHFSRTGTPVQYVGLASKPVVGRLYGPVHVSQPALRLPK